jgi:outer membrane lipoprotein carrier protein
VHFLVLAFLGSSLGFPVTAASNAKQVVARLETNYRHARTLQATFLETYTENGRMLRSESGVAYFRRPGKMRWEYEFPERNLFLVDGKTAWFYVPADHTATRVPAKQSGDWRTPLALLAGEAKVSRVCARVELATSVRPANSDNVVLHCTPRGAKAESAEGGSSSAKGVTRNNATKEPESSTQTDAIFFEIARGSGELARVLIRQSGGVEIEFQFKNWRKDPPLPDSFFRFEPPIGVAIVNGESPSR